MKKNVASQKIGAQMIASADGSAFTSTVTVYVTVDAGVQGLGATASGVCTHEGNGYHTYAPSQGETNGDLVAFTFTGTGAIPATVQIYTRPTTGLLAPTTADRTLDVSAGGEAGIDWANIGSPTTTVGLSGTTVKTATDVETDTADIQSRLPAALGANGNIKADVRDLLGTAWLTPGTAGTPDVNTKLAGGTAWASGAITAAVFAADAITDAKVASDVTIASVTGAVGSVTGAVGSVTGAVGSIASGGITSASFAADSITASAIAADAIGASELAAGAVTEIAAGISIPSAATIADAVWDELRSGHLVDGSFGAVLNALGLHSGAVFSATSSTVRLAASGPSATNDTYNGCWVAITSGTGIGQARLIYDYVGSSKACSITPDWITTPANNDTYVVLSASSINAVYGAVGSVAGNVDGSVASVLALGATAKNDVNDQVVDALATDTYAEPGQGTPSATLSLSAKIGYLFKAWRNKSTQTSTAYNLYNDDAATVDQKATASDDGTTFSRTEITTGP